LWSLPLLSAWLIKKTEEVVLRFKVCIVYRVHVSMTRYLQLRILAALFNELKPSSWFDRRKTKQKRANLKLLPEDLIDLVKTQVNLVNLSWTQLKPGY
jgi:hypothetical protein